MRRFFSASETISHDTIIISDKEQVHHIKDVLRLKINDEAEVFDDKGREYAVIIADLPARKVVFKILRVSAPWPPQKTRVCVACAIPKKSRMDDIIDKLIQLGVDRIIPLMTGRVIVRLDDNKRRQRLERWKKIALSSAKQSQRNAIPVIEPVKNMGQALGEAKEFDLKLLCTLGCENRGLKEALDKNKAKNILVFIGPEGDFSPQEVDLAKEAGCIPVSLGLTVLRVDTAAITAAGFIMLYENS